MIANYGDFEPEHKEKNMKRFSTFSIILILLLFSTISFAAPYPTTPPDAAVTDMAFGGPIFVMQAPAVQHEQIFGFEYKNTLAQTTDMEQDGAAFSVLAEFSCECCGATMIDRPNGDGIYRGPGGDELFSSGFIV